jgi:hypothetical protein
MRGHVHTVAALNEPSYPKSLSHVLHIRLLQITASAQQVDATYTCSETQEKISQPSKNFAKDSLLRVSGMCRNKTSDFDRVIFTGKVVIKFCSSQQV